MDKKEFEKILPTLPAPQKRPFYQWFVAHQDEVSWEQYKSQGYQEVISLKKEVEKHVEVATGKPKQLQLAFMPTETSRTSPFFPMSRKEMKLRPEYQDFIVENNWGRITISGPRLSIYDESVLLALIVLTKKHRNSRFQTTYSELCDNMRVSRGTNTYNAIKEALKRLARAVVDTELYDLEDVSAPRKNKRTIESITGAMVTHVRQQEKTSRIDVEVSPYFLSLYGANLTTALDLNKRAALRTDTAKALYRFLQTHRPSSVPFGLLTLCHGINLNTEQPLKEIRRQIRTALSTLRKEGLITRWRIDKADNVYITRP